MSSVRSVPQHGLLVYSSFAGVVTTWLLIGVAQAAVLMFLFYDHMRKINVPGAAVPSCEQLLSFADVPVDSIVGVSNETIVRKCEPLLASHKDKARAHLLLARAKQGLSKEQGDELNQAAIKHYFAAHNLGAAAASLKISSLIDEGQLSRIAQKRFEYMYLGIDAIRKAQFANHRFADDYLVDFLNNHVDEDIESGAGFFLLRSLKLGRQPTITTILSDLKANPLGKNDSEAYNSGTVRSLQRALKALGFYSGAETGEWDFAGVKALVAFFDSDATITGDQICVTANRTPRCITERLYSAVRWSAAQNVAYNIGDTADERDLEFLIRVTSYLDLDHNDRKHIGSRELASGLAGWFRYISGIYRAQSLDKVIASNVTDCDRLASRDRDPLRIAKGVRFSKIDVDKAIAACTTAISQSPKFRGRYYYNRSRAYERKSQDTEETENARIADWKARALEDLRVSAALSYPFALRELANAEQWTKSLTKDLPYTKEELQIRAHNAILACCWSVVAVHLKARRNKFDAKGVDRVVESISRWAATLPRGPTPGSWDDRVGSKQQRQAADLSKRYSMRPPWLAQ